MNQDAFMINTQSINTSQRVPHPVRFSICRSRLSSRHTESEYRDSVEFIFTEEGSTYLCVWAAMAKDKQPASQSEGFWMLTTVHFSTDVSTSDTCADCRYYYSVEHNFSGQGDKFSRFFQDQAHIANEERPLKGTELDDKRPSSRNANTCMGLYKQLAMRTCNLNVFGRAISCART